MGFEMDAPESMDTGGNFLEQPGWYHFAVDAIDQNPTNKDGMPIDALKVNCHVLAGEHANQKGRAFGMMLFLPKMSDKNNGEFAKKRIARFFDAIVCGTISGGRVSVSDQEMDAAGGRQFVAKVRKEEGKEYVELSFADIYHVDDDTVKDVPKDAAALSLLPASLRRYKDQDAGKGNRRQKPQPEPSAAVAGGEIDLDDL